MQGALARKTPTGIVLGRTPCCSAAIGSVQMELPQLTPAYVEILMVRELRKAGLEVSEVQTHRRADLTEPARVFVLELLAWLRQADWRRRALVGCRRQETLLTEAAAETATNRFTGPPRQAGILVATAGPVTRAGHSVPPGGAAGLRSAAVPT